jgi:hypothetical protein
LWSRFESMTACTLRAVRLPTHSVPLSPSAICRAFSTPVAYVDGKARWQCDLLERQLLGTRGRLEDGQDQGQSGCHQTHGVILLSSGLGRSGVGGSKFGGSGSGPLACRAEARQGEGGSLEPLHRVCYFHSTFSRLPSSKTQTNENAPHHELSRRERQIVDILYSQGRATAAEVQNALPDPKLFGRQGHA